ncbi:unnamed protein product, partial [Linum tenue]
MWTFHMDNGARFGIATTNHGESINGVYKGIRAMPVSVLVEMTYWKKIEEKSSKHRVVLFNRNEGIFAVQTGIWGGGRRG